MTNTVVWVKCISIVNLLVAKTMTIKSAVKKRTPQVLINWYKQLAEARDLSRTGQVASGVDALPSANDVTVESLLAPGSTPPDCSLIPSLPEGTDAVDKGERLALHAMIRALKPKTVLEIGTNVGGSTAHIALGLSQNEKESGARGHLDTLDIVDVNQWHPWKYEGEELSPSSLLKALALDDYVSFKVADSASYLRETEKKYDVIFIDGSHAAPAAYRDIAGALGRVSKGGVIVLHDYFADGKPVWPDGKVIPGPYLAMMRLKRECPGVAVIPIRELPWPTKQGTNRTCLALLVRE